MTAFTMRKVVEAQSLTVEVLELKNAVERPTNTVAVSLKLARMPTATMKPRTQARSVCARESIVRYADSSDASLCSTRVKSFRIACVATTLDARTAVRKYPHGICPGEPGLVRGSCFGPAIAVTTAGNE